MKNDPKKWIHGNLMLYFVSQKFGGLIYTYFPVLFGWITWVIEGLLRLHLTECVK